MRTKEARFYKMCRSNSSGAYITLPAKQKHQTEFMKVMHMMSFIGMFLFVLFLHF